MWPRFQQQIILSDFCSVCDNGVNYYRVRLYSLWETAV